MIYLMINTGVSSRAEGFSPDGSGTYRFRDLINSDIVFAHAALIPTQRVDTDDNYNNVIILTDKERADFIEHNSGFI